MMRRGFHTLLMLALLMGAAGKAHAQNENPWLYVGINPLDLAFRTLTVGGDVLWGDADGGQVGLNFETGFCPRRVYRSMETATDQVKGGFVALGPRFYLGPANDGVSTNTAQLYVGGNFVWGKYVREINVQIPNYYGDITEYARVDHEVLGFNVQAGASYHVGRFIFQAGLEYTRLRSRDDAYGYDYVVPGIGRMGMSEGATERKMNWTFQPVFMIKFAI